MHWKALLRSSSTTSRPLTFASSSWTSCFPLRQLSGLMDCINSHKTSATFAGGCFCMCLYIWTFSVVLRQCFLRITQQVVWIFFLERRGESWSQKVRPFFIFIKSFTEWQNNNVPDWDQQMRLHRGQVKKEGQYKREMAHGNKVRER